MLSNLSLALRTRFERTGDRADLDEAVTAGRDAVAARTDVGVLRRARAQLGDGGVVALDEAVEAPLLLEDVGLDLADFTFDLLQRPRRRIAVEIAVEVDLVADLVLGGEPSLDGRDVLAGAGVGAAALVPAEALRLA